MRICLEWSQRGVPLVARAQFGQEENNLSRFAAEKPVSFVNAGAETCNFIGGDYAEGFVRLHA
jgi:hypothetical protein